MDVRVAHSESLNRGGALVVAEELARMFDTPLFVGFDRPQVVADDIEAVELFNQRLIRWLSEKSSTIRDIYFALAWQHVSELHDADVIVESGNNPGWYIPRDTQAVVRYVHSTPYAAYDRFHDVGQSLTGKLYGTVLRTLYAQTIPLPDVWVANSELVARRIQRYWGVDNVKVVYPPIDIQSYSPSERADYFLTISHLRPEKRIDEIVQAFSEIEETLVVAGDGPERARLERQAPENVDFVGYIDETEKKHRLGEARALVFNAQSEDFGIVPIEAFASGTPVIGVNEGYTQYQINEGKNGVTYNRGVDTLRRTIRDFDPDSLAWSREEIVSAAAKYGRDRFREEMTAAVERAANRATVTVHR